MDPGTRRIGVALSDPDRILAQPLTTLSSRGRRKDVEALVSGDVDSGWAGQAFFIGGLVAIVLATWIIHRTASRELRRQMGEPGV